MTPFERVGRVFSHVMRVDTVIYVNAAEKNSDMHIPVTLKINSFYMAATNFAIGSRGFLFKFSLIFV